MASQSSGAWAWGHDVDDEATSRERHPSSLGARRSGFGLMADILPDIPWEAFVEASKRAAADAEPADG